jgi:hypothetical protein
MTRRKVHYGFRSAHPILRARAGAGRTVCGLPTTTVPVAAHHDSVAHGQEVKEWQPPLNAAGAVQKDERRAISGP